MSSPAKTKKASSLGQLIIPLVALGLLLLFNLIRDPGFYNISVATNNAGNPVLSGNMISIIDSASELAIIAMGMTLVTAACGGQDISVGAVGAIAGAVFVKVVFAFPGITPGALIIGLIACILGAILFKMFNGTLVAVFRIQPMIATLILYSCGRSIAYWINGDATPQISSPILSAVGMTIPGIPIPTPIFLVILMGLLLTLIFKLTNTRLYTQAVGINQGAARLNGINPVGIKLLSFVLLGVCVAVAAVIGIARLGNLSHKTILADIEMDAILAVAIGGNSLGGGKFKMAGSIMGAYIIETLNKTLNAVITHNPASIKAVKAVVIIIIVIAGSPVIKEKLIALFKWMKTLFDDVGRSLMGFATGLAVFGSVAAVAAGIYIALTQSVGAGIGILLGGPVVLLALSWLIYALGQVTSEFHSFTVSNLSLRNLEPADGKPAESEASSRTTAEGGERK